MSVLGRIKVVLSDDERYKAGHEYDVVLTTPQTPDPAHLLTGTMDAPPSEPAPVEPPADG